MRGPGEPDSMSINLWGWREDGRGAVRLGLSEGVSAEVLDLATAGIASAEALYDTWQEGATPDSGIS